MERTRVLAEEETKVPHDEPESNAAVFLALRTGLRMDTDANGRSLEMFLCLPGNDRDNPRVFFLSGVAPGKKAVRCPFCKERHETVSVMEAFEEGWLAVDRGSDESSSMICFEGRDLFLAALHTGRLPRMA